MNKDCCADFTKQQFGTDFKWGVSTAALQIEGSTDIDGKGMSIWDVFAARQGKIKNNHQPIDACDFYNRFKDDIAIVRELNIPNFRFSLSWPRIIPLGKGNINDKGIDYYNRVIDFLLECGITPWVTLYHWDLPHALELRGGWTNRDIISWFSDYVEVCADSLGDRVIHWMVMNEPSVFTGAGYFLGIHAPGKRGITNYLKAIHHATLATATGAQILRTKISDANIGTTFSCTHIEPINLSEKNILAAKRVDTLLNRTFIEPILGLGYPQSDLAFLKKIEKYMRPEDEKNMAFDFDFIGIQCYTREIIKSSFLVPYIGASIVKAPKRNVAFTAMNWEVYPPSIYQMIKKFNGYKGIKRLIITENGAAFPDVVQDGEVKDHNRLLYLQNHLDQVLKAKLEGFNVEGYFVWTLTDNFEWAEGFYPRFGLVYVDFDTQQRIIKESGLWFKEFLK
jgi:beta-glucosidase